MIVQVRMESGLAMIFPQHFEDTFHYLLAEILRLRRLLPKYLLLLCGKLSSLQLSYSAVSLCHVRDGFIF